MVEVYAKRFSLNMGAGTVNPRWVIGAFIIKRKLGHFYEMLDLVDERTVPLSHKYQCLLWVIHTLYDNSGACMMRIAAGATTAL